MNGLERQKKQPFDYNIVLIGFMGTGKTTVSRYLSAMFGMDMIRDGPGNCGSGKDGVSPEIFSTYGEEYFPGAGDEASDRVSGPEECNHLLWRRNAFKSTKCGRDEEKRTSGAPDGQS